MSEFFIKHSKKSMLILSIFVLVFTLLAISVAYIYRTDGDFIAMLGDKKVTKTEFEDAKEKCDGFYKYNSDPKGQERCTESEIEDQILRKALEIEAEKRDITVSEEEITESYKGIVSAYKSEESYQLTMKDAYGWTPEYVRGNIKRDLLQEKLEKYLIASRDGYGVFVRWDWYIGEPSREQLPSHQAPSRELLEKNLYPLVKNGASKEEIRTEIARLRTLGDPWDKAYNIGLIPFTGLNEKKSSDVGPEDWEAISKLQNVGDVTDIVRSSVGQFAVYRLEGKTEGQFNSWEDFKKDAVSKAKVKSVSYKYIQAKKLVITKVEDSVKKLGEKLHITALASHCGYYNFSEFYANISDGSNHALKLSEVSVIARNNAPTRTDLMCDQEVGEYGTSTASDGWFIVGSKGTWDARYGTYSHAPWALSCYHGWYVDVSKNRYDPMRFNRSTAPNGTSIALDRVAETWESYTGPGGSYTTWNNDGNGYIFMKPNEKPEGNFESANCDSITGWALDLIDENYQTPIHIYQTSKNEQWCAVSGGGVGSDSTCAGGYLLPSPTANLSRPDVASAYGITNGNHGFSFGITNDLKDSNNHTIKDGANHWIWAYAFTNKGNPYLISSSPKVLNCSVNICPTLSSSPSEVTQGDPVKLSWSGGSNVASISITHKPSSSISPLALINGVNVGGGSLSVVPSETTLYYLNVTYNGSATPVSCPSDGVPVTVRQNQSGNERVVPSH